MKSPHGQPSAEQSPAGPVPDRPWAVHVAVTLAALLWITFIVNSAAENPDSVFSSPNIWYALIWSVIYVAWLYRVRRGGPNAINTMSMLAGVIGGLGGALVIWLGSQGTDSSDWTSSAPAAALAVAMITVCALLRLPGVQRWAAASHAAAVERRATQSVDPGQEPAGPADQLR
ncbi:hypothetical protein [Actinomadura rudentiformis]|uniref:Uncharacterized protein n=1 Tax=Actinomadura rudentiformis TaxID=359158 RepID=A0A6H9YFW2_9ACTN|nr:hypothetical protein [Actinomadura rudentiformis]KAB2343634.1 hypothetical protein F8566_33395 [Actinomadura rudentiformis]